MKIVYCTPSLYLAGGVERVLTTKVNYLAETLGHDVTVVLTDGAGRSPYYPLSQRVNVVQLDLGFERMWNQPLWRRVWIYLKGMRKYRKRLRSVLCEIRADIVVTTLRREINFLCDIKDGSRKVGELHVTRSHYRNFEDNESNVFKRVIERIWSWQLVRKLKRLDALVVLTPNEIAYWPELDNVHCIPNPLPWNISCERRMYDKGQGSVCTVGRYSYQKGIDLLLEAWTEVHRLHPNWRLDVYGSGERAPYEQQARELGLLTGDEAVDGGAALRLYGADNDIRSRYEEHDFYVLPSRFEGFGMVIIEAESCGLPVVAFDCPTGPRELIADGQTGLLVANGDVKALAEAICHLIEHPEERKKMGQAASEAARPFVLESVMDKWLALFEKLNDRCAE